MIRHRNVTVLTTSCIKITNYIKEQKINYIFLKLIIIYTVIYWLNYNKHNKYDFKS